MKTTDDLRNLLNNIDSIQKEHLEKFKKDKNSLSNEDYKNFNCTCYQLEKAYDILIMAIKGDWGFKYD